MQINDFPIFGLLQHLIQLRFWLHCCIQVCFVAKAKIIHYLLCLLVLFPFLGEDFLFDSFCFLGKWRKLWRWFGLLYCRFALCKLFIVRIQLCDCKLFKCAALLFLHFLFLDNFFNSRLFLDYLRGCLNFHLFIIFSCFMLLFACIGFSEEVVDILLFNLLPSFVFFFLLLLEAVKFLFTTMKSNPINNLVIHWISYNVVKELWFCFFLTDFFF